jgi:hypothetical protein
MDEMRTGYVNTDENYGDLMTKTLPRGERREKLLRGVMWDIHSKAKGRIARSLVGSPTMV